MKKFYLLVILVVLTTFTTIAQVSINTDGSAPNPAAMLDVKSTTRGLLPPRMTTEQMNGIITPPNGLLVFNTSVNALYWFDGETWKKFSDANFTETDPVFSLHPASSIFAWDINNWNNAYSWGNHAEAGYLTSFTETDPMFFSHPASNINYDDLIRWNEGYYYRVTNAWGSYPLVLNLYNNELSGFIFNANSWSDGILTSYDWNYFNNKQDALTFGTLYSSDIMVTGGEGAVIGNGVELSLNKGPLTESGSSVLNIYNGENAVLGEGSAIEVLQANSEQSGYLSNADWNNFNEKVSSQWTTNDQNISYTGGQVSVGTTTPEPSAAVEVSSTTQGFLPPRMTMEQRDAIENPAIGLVIYCLDCESPNNLQIFIGTSWNPIAYNRFPYVTDIEPTGNPIVGNMITGNYTYNDADNDPEGMSVYRWYRADDDTGLNETVIPGANDGTYILGAEDMDKYIRFGVVPVALSGATPGSEVKAAYYIGPVTSSLCEFSTLNINHLTSGGVAPVNKTTTYSVVTNIPGEPTKCWISSNLGSDHQATAVDDSTEASAGWYWQFNHKQGYKHNGSTLTPAWTTTYISEDSDWQSFNDPCTLELGAAWRLPTGYEWWNVSNEGAWTNWNGPWTSGLKLHAAGYLQPTGSLTYRGANGPTWSSTQYSIEHGYYLDFTSDYCQVLYLLKTFGFPVRCLSEGVATDGQNK